MRRTVDDILAKHASEGRVNRSVKQALGASGGEVKANANAAALSPEGKAAMKRTVDEILAKYRQA